MSKDSNRTYVHLNQPRVADLFEEFSHPSLPLEDIYVPPQHQPPNPEDEDDVVPDQHAAFGIQRATQRQRESEWKDLGLEELMAGVGLNGGSAVGRGTGTAGRGWRRGWGGASAVASGSGLPR